MWVKMLVASFEFAHKQISAEIAMLTIVLVRKRATGK
jgi:hypothetical protein